jgi:hypothetical protein
MLVDMKEARQPNYLRERARSFYFLARRICHLDSFA